MPFYVIAYDLFYRITIFFKLIYHCDCVGGTLTYLQIVSFWAIVGKNLMWLSISFLPA